jgi:Xaa-Pro aminopeptidase
VKTATLPTERRTKLGAAMTAAGIDVLVAYGNGWQGDYLMYVSDFAILEGHGLAVLTPDGACTLYLDSASEIDRATAETGGIDVRFSQAIGRDVAGDLRARGNVRVAAAPLAFVPFALVENAPMTIEDGTALLDACLMYKTPAEVDRVRKAAQTADKAYVIFRQAAQEGRKQFEVVAETEAWLRANGVADNFMLIGSGGTDIRSVTPPSNRKLAKGDNVITELTPAVEGYFAQICRTLVVGKASDAQKRAMDIYIEALEAGIAAVKPGVLAADVARAENDVFRKYDMGEYVTSAYTRVRGHGLGLFCDSKPHILEDVQIELKPGMTFVVHPNTYNPNVGYMMLGDSLTVTDTGCEVFTTTPRVLFDGASN